MFEYMILYHATLICIQNDNIYKVVVSKKFCIYVIPQYLESSRALYTI